MSITISFPDGSSKQYPKGTSGMDIAKGIGERLAQAALAIKVNGTTTDLSAPINEDARIQILTFRDEEGKKVFWHSSAHLLAMAVTALWPDAKPTIGPAIDQGFYYDFEKKTPFSNDDLVKIEAKMQEIVDKNMPFVKKSVSEAEAKELVKGNPYKLELVEEFKEGGLTFYTNEGFADLCRGPHVPSTGIIRAFKLTNISSAYWRGDAKKASLQRIYGISFPDKKDLKEHVQQNEEAAKRDHRVIGPKLGLFVIDEKVGQGLVLWKPKGAIIRTELQKFISEHLVRQGYSQVFTPHIGRLELYKTSGHFPYYRDSQFPAIIEREQMEKFAEEGMSCSELCNCMAKGEVDGYLLKPMNCPHHIRIYASESRSYRDLPIRLAEFGTVYRWEKSGDLGGMTRVRGFTQDDAHLFVTEDQLAAEVAGCLELVKIVLSTLGMNQYRVRVGLRDPDKSKYVGSDEQWEKAEKACRDAASSLGVPFTAEKGEAAFYGPKIDFVVKDVIGREWQLGTVQVDYQLPQRFELSYAGNDNQPHAPVMIHRAPFGSMERFIGVLIEHFAGAFPLWLSPEQVRILPIADRHVEFCNAVAAQMKDAGLRVSVDAEALTTSKKIRNAQLDKVNVILVAGDKEMERDTLNVRLRDGTVKGEIATDTLIAQLVDEVKERRC